MTIGNCTCLGEYEKNLLIAALAEYKSSLQTYTKGVQDEFFINLVLQRSRKIDSVIKDIEDISICQPMNKS